MSLKGEKVHLSAEKHFKDKVTLVSCIGSRFSQRMVDAWLNGMMSADIPETDRPSQVVWLNFAEGPLFYIGIFRRMLLISARYQFSTEKQACTLYHFGNSLQVRQRLGMTNRYLGYVCAVDSQGIVRWHVHAMDPPEQEELAALGKLIREMHSKQKRKQLKI
uniref:Uncharacterized protein n=2 Tax=Chrysotila carterae TaxID=13221 RepID=A0A7S4B1J0_CHRCT